MLRFAEELMLLLLEGRSGNSVRLSDRSLQSALALA